MQFQVPQFIETEDKIVGPLTLKQFLYLGIAGLISFMFFFVFRIWLWLIITAFLGIIAASLAFIKYNGRPLINVLFAALKYSWNPHLYLWKSAQEIAQKQLPEITAIKEQSPLQKLFLKIRTAIPFRRKEVAATQQKTYQQYKKERQTARRRDYR